MSNRKQALQDNIEDLKNDITDDFEIFVKVNKNSRKIIGVMNDIKDIVISEYVDSMDYVEEFLELIQHLLEKYSLIVEKSFMLKYYYEIKKKNNDYYHNIYKQINDRLNKSIEQLTILKKEELEKNICVENVELANIINNTEYNSFLDVNEYVKGENSYKDFQKNITKNITNLVNTNSKEIQMLDYMILETKFLKKLLKSKKDEVHKYNTYLQGEIDKITNYKEEKSIELNDELRGFCKNLDEVTLSIIVAICAQLNLFEVKRKDNMLDTETSFVIKAPTKNAYILYINQWFKGLKKYIHKEVGL